MEKAALLRSGGKTPRQMKSIKHAALDYSLKIG